MISLYVCSVCLCYVTREGQGYLTDVHFSSMIHWHCRSFGQQGVKTEKFVSISSFLNQRRSIRIEEPYAIFIYIASYCIILIMPCVVANSLPLSELPGFDKENVTMYIVNPQRARTDAIVLSLFVFYSLRTEERINCRRIEKQRKKINCYVRLS